MSLKVATVVPDRDTAPSPGFFAMRDRGACNPNTLLCTASHQNRFDAAPHVRRKKQMKYSYPIRKRLAAIVQACGLAAFGSSLWNQWTARIWRRWISRGAGGSTDVQKAPTSGPDLVWTTRITPR